MIQSLNIFEAPLEGISLVEASAGTGKTYNITSLYIRTILEKNYLPNQILVLTYTDAATAELKFRLRDRLQDAINAISNNNSGGDDFLEKLIQKKYENAEAKLKKALDSFDEAAVFTIHGFCHKLLNELGLQFDVAPGFKVLNDNSELLQECVDDFWRSFIRSAMGHPEQRIILEYFIDDGFGPDELMKVAREVIDRPYARLEPSSVSMNEMKALIKELSNKFEALKYYWEEDREHLLELLQSGKIKKNRYSDKIQMRLLDDLNDCLEDAIPKVKPFKDFHKWGHTTLSDSGKKGVVVPEFNFTKVTDEFLQICEKLESLKPAFVINTIDEIKEDFNSRKESANVLTYNDFLLKVDNGLKNDATGSLAKRLSREYPVALVDEFQDTDPIQYNIFRQIYADRKNTALFMIGDPKQAIYGFRGADIYTYLKAKGDADKSQSYTLDFNYRSNDKMIAAVNEVFQQAENPFLIEGLRFKAAQFPPHKDKNNYLINGLNEIMNPLQCIKLEDIGDVTKKEVEAQVYDEVVNEIVHLLSDGYAIDEMPVQQNDIAVLVRNSYQGEYIQQKLREKGLKSVLKSKSSIFKSTEADELFLILKSIQKLSDEPGIRAALATEMLGFTATDIQKLLSSEEQWAKVYYKFVELKEEWETNGIEAAIESIISTFGIKKKLSVKTDFERRITNLMHLSELLSKAEREHRLFNKSLLKWFYRKKADDSKSSEDEELRLESDGELIQISTIHAAKGLQYPIVFCPFLWDSPKRKNRSSTFRFYRDEEVHIDINTGVLDEERVHHKFLDYKEEMAEATRLAYVALTRAVSACYIFIPDFKTLECSPIASVTEGKEQAGLRARNTVKKEDMGVNYSYEQLLQRFESGQNITVREAVPNQEYKRDEIVDSTSEELKAAKFDRDDLFEFSRMLSYSSLALHKEPTDSELDYGEVYTNNEITPVEYNRFNFPRGANAGTCLHKIFEDLSFDQPQNLQSVVNENLELHGFSSKWSKIVQIWVDEVLKHHLSDSGISLKALKKDEILKEMEFHFPVNALQTEKLWDIIRGNTAGQKSQEKLSGFMKGYIDLTFQYEGKYYILDYKSNHLGNLESDYSPEALQNEMLHSAYDIQYHIYSTALHRYLRHRIKDYTYNEHFGGVFYVFLRAVNVEQQGSGVFFHKPEKNLIEKLDSYFEKGEKL